MAKLVTGTTINGILAATILDIQSQTGSYVLATGSSNNYAGTYSPAVTALVAGLTLMFKAHQTNTGSATFNPNGLGAKVIKKYGTGLDLAAGDILNGQIISVVYDGIYFQLMNALPDPSEPVVTTLSDFLSLLATIGTVTPATIILGSGTWVFDVNLDLSAYTNITLTIQNGTMLQVAVGKVLTIGGSLNVGVNQQIFNGTGTVVFGTGINDIYVAWFGTTPEAIATAIVAGKGKNLHWNGTYTLNTAISVTAIGHLTWIADGPVIVQYTGTEPIGGAADAIVTIELAGYDLTVKGKMTFDANSLARKGLDVRNITAADMTSASNVTLYDVHGINAYNTSVVGYGTRGMQFYGGFNMIRLEKCSAKNISRAAGVGVAGSQGSAGIFVTAYAASTLYPRMTTIEDVDIDTVTSLEVDGTIANADHDGLSVQGLAPSGTTEYESTLVVRGGRFRNCRGRMIKSQTEYNMISGITIVRDASADKANDNAVEVDFQRGSGILRDFTVIYNPLTGGGTPLDEAHKIVGAYIGAATTTDGAIYVQNGTIINNIPSATDTIPYFFVLDGATGAYFNQVVIKDISFLGVGRVGNIARGTFSRSSRLVVDNVNGHMTGALVSSADECKDSYMELSCNYNSGSAVALVDQTDPGYSQPKISGHGNYGFIESCTSVAAGQYAYPELRTGKIVAANRYVQGGGSIVIESALIAADGTHVFSKRGYQNGTALYFVSVHTSSLCNGIFAHGTVTGTRTVVNLTPEATDIAYHASVDPSTADKLNIWMDTNYCINVHNKLLSSGAGTTALVTLASIG